MRKYREDILAGPENGLSGLVLNNFNRLNENIAGDMPYNSIDRYRLYFAAGASYNAAMYWLQNGCRESIDELNACICCFMGIKAE